MDKLKRIVLTQPDLECDICGKEKQSTLHYEYADGHIVSYCDTHNVTKMPPYHSNVKMTSPFILGLKCKCGEFFTSVFQLEEHIEEEEKRERGEL